jgi:hypothetical protein
MMIYDGQAANGTQFLLRLLGGVSSGSHYALREFKIGRTRTRHAKVAKLSCHSLPARLRYRSHYGDDFLCYDNIYEMEANVQAGRMCETFYAPLSGERKPVVESGAGAPVDSCRRDATRQRSVRRPHIWTAVYL